MFATAKRQLPVTLCEIQAKIYIIFNTWVDKVKEKWKMSGMGKTLVMYYSEKGTTKRYAEWIAKELNGNLYNIKNVKSNMLSDYDVIILGSPMLAGAPKGTIKGLSIFTKNYDLIKDKKIVFYSCGLFDVGNEEVRSEIRGYIEKAVPDEVFHKIKIFYLRGGFDYYKLNPISRLVFSIIKKKMDKKPADKLTSDEKFVLACYGKVLDFTDKGNVKPIVEYCI